MLVVVVVAGIAVVMARGAVIHLRLDEQAVAQAQCRAAGMGVLRAVLDDLSSALAAGRVPTLSTVVAGGETLGGCTVLLIGRDPSGKRALFGLVPEAGRIGVNSLADPALPVAQRLTFANALAVASGCDPSLLAAVRDWRDEDDDPDPEGGAERTDGAYLGAPVPYAPRNGPLEGVDELRLVRGVGDALFFGGDANQNGRLDAGEDGTGDGRPLPGLRDLVSLENREPAIAGDGLARTPILVGRPQRLNTGLQARLTSRLGAARGQEVWNAIRSATKETMVANRLELFSALGDALSEDESAVLWPVLVGPEGRLGLVDAWSCPDALLAAVVGDAVAATIIKARPATPPNGPQWLVRALTRAQARICGQVLTSGSYRFRADLLAVRNDGAGWVRLEAAIDCTTGSPAITALRTADSHGWPLPWCAPERLRARSPDQDPITLLTSDGQ